MRQYVDYGGGDKAEASWFCCLLPTGEQWFLPILTILLSVQVMVLSLQS
jgi:hypothetical protein